MVVAFLNEAAIEYSVQLDSPNIIDLFNSTDDYRPPNGYLAEIVHKHVIPENIEAMAANWWWRYELTFECFYGSAAVLDDASRQFGTPITDPAQLHQIRQELNRLLRLGMAIVATFDFFQKSHEIVGFAVEDPRYSTTPFIDGPPTLPPTLAPTFTPLNVTLPTVSPTTWDGHSGPNDPDNNGNVDAGDKGTGPLGDRYYPSLKPVDAQYWVRTFYGERICCGLLLVRLRLAHILENCC
jgi:hypothetical protein